MPDSSLPIVNIGTIFYIPIDTPHYIDLSDFSPNPGEISNGAEFIEYAIATPYFDAHHEQPYIAFQITFFSNGDALTLTDIVDGELKRVYEYLHDKGLVSSMDYPGVVQYSPFDLVPQNA